MPKYLVETEFVLSRAIEVVADSPGDAEQLILGASSAQITEILGRSYADVSETTRKVLSVGAVA